MIHPLNDSLPQCVNHSMTQSLNDSILNDSIPAHSSVTFIVDKHVLTFGYLAYPAAPSRPLRLVTIYEVCRSAVR